MLPPADSPYWPHFLAGQFQQQIKYPGKPTIFCLDRDQFCHDVKVLRETGEHFNYYAFDVGIADYIQKDWMPKDIQRQFENDDHKRPVYAEAWARAQTLYEAIFGKFVKHFGLTAVLTANWNYWTDEGARLACRKMGIPYLVLLRESYFLRSQKERAPEYFRTRYTLRPEAEGIAVCDESTRTILADCNVMKRELMQVTGWPRLDPWLPVLRQPLDWSGRDAIMLMTYTAGYLSGDHFQEMLAAFVKAAEKYSESGTRFVVKCKHLNDRKEVEQMLSRFPAHRLTLSHDTVFNSVKTAKAVIGFNSASVVEALLSGVPVYVPHWGDTAGDPKSRIFARDIPGHSEHIRFIESPEEFDGIIDDLVGHGPERRDDRAARIRLVKNFVEIDPDVSATVRVEKFLRDFTGAA